MDNFIAHILVVDDDEGIRTLKELEERIPSNLYNLTSYY